MCWQLLFLLVLFQACFLSSPSPSPSSYLCLHDEHSALLQFKQKHYHVSINYPTSLNSWKPNTDCCFWEGISCDGTTGHVVGLALFNSSLHGSIHSNSTLFNLLQLQMLDISRNSFEHFAPSGFVRLSGLWHLNLSANSFSGQFPSEISNLTNLVSLDLSSNNFLGQIPSEISNLTKLVSLDLSANYFLGQIPSEISNLTKLVSLDLSWNEFQLEIPNLRAFVQTLTMLRELRLDQVNLSAQINRDWCHHLLSALPNLHVLSLTDCSLTGPLDASISSFHSLTELHLESNENLVSKIPSSWMNLTSLTVLNLHGCGFYGDFPSSVFLLPKLSYIDLSFNPLLSGHLPEFPQINASLQYLYVEWTKFQGRLPSSIGNLKFLKDLYLDHCNLSGPIPPSISNLTHLEGLLLNNNLLQGPIHFSLFYLPSMYQLDLSFNQFNEIVNEPPPIYNISSPFSNLLVPQILLSDNHLRAEDLMSLISKIKGTIEVLDLSFNDFGNLGQDINLSYDGFPSSNHSGDINFSNAKSLAINLRSCNISKFPENFLRNQELELLDLSYNRISKFPENFLKNQELELLDLSYNRISKFPKFLKDLKEVNSLLIGANIIGGEIPKWIWLQSCRELNLSNNKFTGLELPLPDHSFNTLEILDLHSNMMQECQSSSPCSPQTFDEYDREVVSHILGNLTSFFFETTYFFSISNNKLTGKIPSSICKGSNLEVLDLSNNQLSGNIPTCLSNSNLGVINLQRNQLHGPIPHDFKDGCNLHTLKLNKNNLQGDVPRSLSNCKSLTVLDISDNQLSGTFPHWLENLIELQVLVLRSNKFGGSIAQPVQAHSPPFPSLHVIDLSFNNFTGDLPLQYILHWTVMMCNRYLYDLYYHGANNSAYYQDTIVITEKGTELNMQRILTAFTAIDLSSNFFVGKIPDALGNLKALNVLNLSGNSLTGQIPFTMGNLSGLESLDLSRNKLSGEIPMQLVSLTFLEVLDLSYNNLIGIIPQGSQFNTFSNASYAGNAGLCGFPLTKKCGVLPPASTIQKGDDDDDYDDETCLFDWRFALAGYCAGVIVGLVVGRELFWRKNRCFEFISRLVVSKQRKGSSKTKCQNREK